jgi:hypothetical protein
MTARPYALIALLGLGLGTGAVAGCATSGSNQPAPSGSAQPSIATLAKQYLAIAEPANRVLDRCFDALEDDDGDLGAAAALLRTIVATERGFDRELLTLTLPPAMRKTALELVRVNEARADFTARAATATSVASLRRFEPDLEAMNTPVEEQVRLLRKDLSLPPPDTD